jgi:putative hydrolase of the HAD superfamily
MIFIIKHVSFVAIPAENPPGPVMATKAIFFDAAGTLMKPSRKVGESYAAFAVKYGVDVSPAALSERFRICFDQAPRLAFPGAPEEQVAVLERDWWKSLVARVFEPWRPFVRFDEFFADLFAYFAGPQAWSLYPDVPDTLARLKRCGLKLSVISNFDSRLAPILGGLGIGSSFERIFVSSRVGYAKPDAQIFHAALKHHELRPEHTIHVGDSEINDRLGANKAGLRGVLIDRSRPAAADDSERISSLASILNLVGSPSQS